MTGSHGWRCWNTYYMYKEDLLWVWTGRGVSIISTNRDSYLLAKHNILRSLGAYIRLELHPSDHRSHCSRCWNLLYMYKEDLRVDVVGIGGGYLLVLMIQAPHSIHTHSRSSLYMYNAIQHLWKWLPVIRMPPHPEICYLGPESGCRGCRRWTLSRYLWLIPPTPAMSINNWTGGLKLFNLILL